MFKVAIACLFSMAVFVAEAVSDGTNVIMRTVVSIRYSDEGGYSGTYVTNTVAVPIQWDVARAKLAVAGRMTMKKQMAVMVNNQVLVAGDTVKVEQDLSLIHI